jgi:hypothetical protein
MMEKPKKPDSIFEYMKSPWYQKERDGKLSDFIEERCFGGPASALFKGIEAFNMLEEKNLLKNGHTSIRVMWNVGRGDEHYTVVEQNGEIMLEGVTSTKSHDGMAGLHKPEDILERKLDGYKNGVTMSFELEYPNLEAIEELRKKGE